MSQFKKHKLVDHEDVPVPPEGVIYTYFYFKDGLMYSKNEFNVSSLVQADGGALLQG